MTTPVCGRTKGEDDRMKIMDDPNPDITAPTRRVRN
jgi:hypothetical protein